MIMDAQTRQDESDWGWNHFQSGKAEPRFTIEEIAEYIAGWHLSSESGALGNALSQLRDEQDGILAVRARRMGGTGKKMKS